MARPSRRCGATPQGWRGAASASCEPGPSWPRPSCGPEPSWPRPSWAGAFLAAAFLAGAFLAAAFLAGAFLAAAFLRPEPSSLRPSWPEPSWPRPSWLPEPSWPRPSCAGAFLAAAFFEPEPSWPRLLPCGSLLLCCATRASSVIWCTGSLAVPPGTTPGMVRSMPRRGVSNAWTTNEYGVPKLRISPRSRRRIRQVLQREVAAGAVDQDVRPVGCEALHLALDDRPDRVGTDELDEGQPSCYGETLPPPPPPPPRRVRRRPRLGRCHRCPRRGPRPAPERARQCGGPRIPRRATDLMPWWHAPPVRWAPTPPRRRFAGALPFVASEAATALAGAATSFAARFASLTERRLNGPRTGDRFMKTQPTYGTGLPPTRRPGSNSHAYWPWNSWKESLESTTAFGAVGDLQQERVAATDHAGRRRDHLTGLHRGFERVALGLVDAVRRSSRRRRR